MKSEKIRELFWGAAVLIAWACIIILLIKADGNLSVEYIANALPKKQSAAFVSMLGLFLLKSTDFVIYSGVLYAVSGARFPLLYAVRINLAGVIIMITIPYLAGKSVGRPMLERLRDKHPKFREIDGMLHSGEVAVSLLLRIVGIPLHLASFYLGAAGFNYIWYLIGSVMGLMTEVWALTIIGMNTASLSPMAFLIVFTTKLLLIVTPIMVYFSKRRK